MLYLRLSAEYSASSLRHEHADPPPSARFDPSPELAARIDAWNAEYSMVIPMPADERNEPENRELIDRLDQVGLDLADAVVTELGDAKVRYYSEGKLCWVDRR